jgi:L-asparagine transporter-like permease
MTPQSKQPVPHQGLPAHWVSGLVLVAIGTIFFLTNLHLVRFHDLFRFWPAILIVAGVAMLADRLTGPNEE